MDLPPESPGEALEAPWRLPGGRLEPPVKPEALGPGKLVPAKTKLLTP
jgi:hypothetical protein